MPTAAGDASTGVQERLTAAQAEALAVLSGLLGIVPTEAGGASSGVQERLTSGQAEVFV